MRAKVFRTTLGLQPPKEMIALDQEMRRYFGDNFTSLGPFDDKYAYYASPRGGIYMHYHKISDAFAEIILDVSEFQKGAYAKIDRDIGALVKKMAPDIQVVKRNN